MGILDAPGLSPTKAGADQIAALRSNVMRSWWAALADCDNAPADILLVDDSTGEGQATTTTKPWLENTWSRRLVSILRQQCMTTPGGGPGYIPAWYACTVAGAGFVWAGSPTLDAGFSGLGCRSTKLTAAAHIGTITLSGLTSIDLLFTKASGGGTFSYALDGGTATQVSVANATTAYGQRQRVTIPDTGSHVLTIAWVSGQVWFEGVMAYNGDETKGIRLWDSAHSGFRSGQFSGDDITGGGTAGHTWDRSIPSTIALAFNGLGLNDYGGNIGSAVYKTRMANLNAAIRAKIGPTVPIVMLAKYRRTDSVGVTAEASDPWANYVAALKSLAAADPYLYVIDLTARMLPASQDTLGLVTGDQVHIGNKGHRFVAHAISRQVSPLSGA